MRATTRRTTTRAGILLVALTAAGNAAADNAFGVGVKAGTLGVGIEGTWRPLPYLDVRLGANRFDYDDTVAYSGIDYDATLGLDTLYATANFRFPLSPFRVTGGLYSNGNEVALTSEPGGDFDFGDGSYTSADVGTVTGTATFPSTAPYFGIGYDFSLFGKVGLNFDLGVLWQGEAEIALDADGPVSGLPDFQEQLEAERQQLETDISDYKAWPVVSLGFVVNF
jgi:hypothetical protein